MMIGEQDRLAILEKRVVRPGLSGFTTHNYCLGVVIMIVNCKWRRKTVCGAPPRPGCMNDHLKRKIDIQGRHGKNRLLILRSRLELVAKTMMVSCEQAA
jgi:hypothetical protein